MHRVCQLLFGEEVAPSPEYMKTETYKREKEEREKRQAATSPVKAPQSKSDAPKVQTPPPSEPQILKPDPTRNTARDRNSVDFTYPYGIRASATRSRRRGTFF